MSDRRLQKLKIVAIAVWAVVVATSWWLWQAYLDPKMLPADGTLWSRGLGIFGGVVYDDPALIARVRVSRMAIIASVLLLGVLGCVEHRRVIIAVRRFWTTPVHPINLAIFRIAVFLQAYSLCHFDFIAPIADLPDALQFPLATGIPNLGPLSALAYWPLNPLTGAQVDVLGKIMVAACFTGMLGLFSRTSAFVTALLFFGAWGSAQWYGKVDHHHHVFWFLAVLATSRCGDALSFDALWRAWRSSRIGIVEPPGENVAYALPLRMSMFLIGITYLFPGLWKISRSGFDWFMGDTAYYQIYDKWHSLGQWTPFFRVDEIPLLVHGGALATILFETTFILLLFGRHTIYLAGIIGASFHTLLNIFMRHGFETLRNAYVMFINWHALFTWVGGRVFPGKLHVIFDARATRGAATVAVVRTFDWFGAIQWSDVSESEGVEGIDLSEGSKAWRRALLRIPVLWPVIPLLYLIPSAGRADARATSESTRAERRTHLSSTSAARLRSIRATAAVGFVLACGLVITGAQRRETSWPVSCYPLFDGILDDNIDLLRIDAIDAAGTIRSIEPDDYNNELGGRWRYVLQRIIWADDGPRRQELLNAVWGVVQSREPNLANTKTIRFYTHPVWLDPDRWDEAPGPAKLIHEIKR